MQHQITFRVIFYYFRIAFSTGCAYVRSEVKLRLLREYQSSRTNLTLALISHYLCLSYNLRTYMSLFFEIKVGSEFDRGLLKTLLSILHTTTSRDDGGFISTVQQVSYLEKHIQLLYWINR